MMLRVCCLVLLFCAAAGADPAAEAQLREFQMMRPPALDLARRHDAEYQKAYTAEQKAFRERRKALALQFADRYPEHPAAAEMILFTALRSREDQARQLELFRRIVTKYPDSEAAAEAQGPIRLLESVGNPFELSFKDAITGKQVSMADLKGKIVVVDFWAAWCPDCLAEMPALKSIHGRYRDKGVEFIGVSLDEPEADGGLAKLRDYVATQQIPWPQYYQGNGWESPFSKSWGITALPRVLLVAQDGTVYSNDAGAKLETLIEELLAKRK